MIAVDQSGTVFYGPFLIASQVDMNLGRGPAGARFAHFPEIVFFIAVENAFGRQVLLPGPVSLLVSAYSQLFIPFKYRGIEARFIDFIHIRQQLPGPVDGFLFEVISERPVSQHLKHGVMVGIVAHFLQIIVLARNPEALLYVSHTGCCRCFHAQKDILKLVHSGIGEHQRGVVFDYNGSRGDNQVIFFLEIAYKCLPNILCSHILCVYNALFL